MSSTSPQKMANQLSNMLSAVLGDERFPVNVEELIYEYSKNFPDPVTKIRKVSLDGFEGMLRPSKKRNEWHILYNESPAYVGRERFTLAHEFCHYLLDRTHLDQSITDRSDLEFHCNPLNQNQWNKSEHEREQNADTFASYLLMPINDFRIQTQGQTIDLELFRHITNRYGVSLTAALLKWIEFTDQMAAMIISRDGFALWGRASSSATKRGIFIQSGMGIPENSHSSSNNSTDGKLVSIPPQSWPLTKRAQATHEMSIYSTRIEKTITLVLFKDNEWVDHDEEQTFDSFDRFTNFEQAMSKKRY